MGALACAGGGAYGFVSSKGIRVERHTLNLPRWNADGFRVTILADFHLVGQTALERALEAVEIGLQEPSDVIVLLGDYVESSLDASIERLVSLLDSLKGANAPVLAVLGNHDYWTERPRRVINTIADASHVKLLRNEAETIKGVKIGGVDDAIGFKAKPEFLKDLGEENVLALFHEPDFVDTLPQNVALQLAGHSHGGQVCLPGGKPMVLPRGAREYYRGFYPDAHVPLYVSRGIGTSGPDLRAFCPPEVSVLTLRSEA